VIWKPRECGGPGPLGAVLPKTNKKANYQILVLQVPKYILRVYSKKKMMQLVIYLFVYTEIFSTSLLTHCSQKIIVNFTQT